MPNRYNIFYADDDRDDRDLFRDAVSDIDERYKVYTLRNGSELMNLLHNPPPEPGIVFLDLNMPVMSGFEVLATLNAEGTHTQVPVVVFSTSKEPEDIVATKHLGADMYIPKANDFTEYVESIRYALSIDWKNFSASENNFVYKNN